MRWIGVLLTLLIVSPACADPFEVSPYRVSSEITVKFGTGENELAPRSEDWGKNEEVGRFGPFTVDEDGTVYLADIRKNTVMIFSAEGTYQRSVPMKKSSNLVDDLVVQDGALYWIGETPWGHRAYRLDLANGDTLGFAVSDDPSLRQIAGKRATGNLRLEILDRGIGLVDRSAGTCVPLVRDEQVLPPAQQLAMKASGSQPGQPAVGFTWEDTITTSGERTWGDVVLLDEAGRPAKILMKNAAPPDDVAGRCFLLRYHQQGSRYFVVMDLDGQTLTRTRIPDRKLDREIHPAKFLELGEDGSFWELYLTEENGQLECRIVHWAR